MKSTTLLLVSEGLLILAIVLVFSAVKGSVGFNVGWPINQFVLTISTESRGIPVALALVSLLLAATTLVAGLVGLIKEPRRSA